MVGLTDLDSANNGGGHQRARRRPQHPGGGVQDPGGLGQQTLGHTQLVGGQEPTAGEGDRMRTFLRRHFFGVITNQQTYVE